MARLNTLSEVTFDVALQPLYVKMGDRDVQARASLAVVQRPSGRVLGVVGRAYRLVSHSEALSLAYDCVHAAFPENQAWGVARRTRRRASPPVSSRCRPAGGPRGRRSQ